MHFPRVTATVVDFTKLLGIEVKSLMKQLLEGVEYIHKHDIIHRYTSQKCLSLADTNAKCSDIKMSNLLYTNNGILKLGRFVPSTTVVQIY